MIPVLDWLIAWRHLRVAESRPAWVVPLVAVAVYLLVIGVGMALWAASLDGSDATVAAPWDPPAPPGPTPLQRYYGFAAAVTLALGTVPLVFGLLSWFFNLLATIITMSVLLGCMALVVVLSLMTGLENDLRDKILAQKAHIRIARVDGRPFADYLPLVEAVAAAPGVAGASPYVEGEIMVRSGLNRQGALLIGIFPDRQAGVSNLPTIVQEGSYDFLDRPEAIPEPDPFAFTAMPPPFRLRHLDRQRRETDEAASADVPIPEIDGPEGPDPAGETSGSPVEAADDTGGWEDPRVVLGTAGPRERPAAEPEVAGEDETGGWEDPEQEIARLRAEGVLPPAAPDPAEDEPALAEPESPVPEPVFGIADPLLVGRELASELGVRVGTVVQLSEPGLRMTPAGWMPGQLTAKVAGVFHSGMYEYDRKNVYSPIGVVQRFLRVGDAVSGIEIKLVDIDRLDEGKALVEAVVAAEGRGDELLVEDWRDLNRNLFSAMFLEKVAMFVALLFVVLVASFGILASNLMSVIEKSKEIAILKAMGTSDRTILRIFVAEGLCLGMLGAAGGIALGLVSCWALDTFGFPLNENVYYIQKLPAVVDFGEVALVGVAALVIVWLSSLYPARLASRLRPVDALRQVDR